MNRRGVGLVLVGVSVLATACGRSTEDESGELTLQTSTVTRGNLKSSVEATGTIEPIRMVEVRSQASGEILQMPVELGDRVQPGDLLVEIDPRDEVNQLEQARADLQQREAELNVAQSRLERMQSLRDSGVVTTEELESATVSHAQARSAYVRAQTQLELAQEQRADATVRAPLAGTVIQKNVEQGQVVTGTRDLTGGTVLLVLADLANVQVRTLVDESEIGDVEPGLPASITVEAYPDRTFHGEVLQVEPQATVEQNVTMFAVLTRIANEENLLKPGMNADVEIVEGEKENVLKLSNSGVKLPAEAGQLVSALGMDPALLQQSLPRPGTEMAGASSGGGADAAAATGERGEPPVVSGEGDLPSPDAMASMSPDERRELFRSLTPEQRQELRSRVGPTPRSRGSNGSTFAREGGAPPGGFTPGSGGRGSFGGSGSGSRRTTGPRKAFVFVRTPEGGLTLKPILVGLSSWEETEVVAGLEEGDEVVNVPLALVQQSQMLERFRSRMPGLGGFGR